MKRRTCIAAMAALSLTTVLPVHAAESGWPTRPVRLLVGFPGGSSPDLTARILAEPLSKALGQPVIVENKPGASGNIATAQVARATDGHTIGLVINGNLTSSALLNPKLPYNPARDFTYISLLTRAPLVLVAAADAPAGRAFFAAARAAGDRWNYGSVGVGSVAHLGMELLNSRAGMAPVHVPYPGTPQIVTAILGGQVQMGLIAPGVALPQVKAGKLRAIGVTSGRSTLAPQLPSLSEAGLADFNLEVWNALVGPAGMSPAAKARLGAEVGNIVRSEQVRQKLFAQGWQAVGSSEEGLKRRVQEETAMLQGIISTRGIKLD